MSQVGRKTRFRKSPRKYNIDFHVSGPRRPNENPSEGAIRELKRRFYRVMFKNAIPMCLWDFLVVWLWETGNLTVSSSRYANGRTTIEIVTGETPDISEYIDFSFYDWVTFRSEAGFGQPRIGRWLGVSHKIAQAMFLYLMHVSTFAVRTSRFFTRALTFAVSHDKILDKIHSSSFQSKHTR